MLKKMQNICNDIKPCTDIEIHVTLQQVGGYK